MKRNCKVVNAKKKKKKKKRVMGGVHKILKGLKENLKKNVF